ncbi:MAG: hypothetical protein JWN84_958 [Nocardioides sp.]|nr:hypothetical protein [Nocardioides sp.]
MTDLEDHWDDLPVGPAPVDAILREARRTSAASGRRRPEARLRRSLTGVVALGGVAAAFVAGTLVATGPGTPSGPAGVSGGGADGSGMTPVAFQGALQAPASCEELLEHYVDRGVDLVSEYGWGAPYGYGLREAEMLGGPFDEFAGIPQATAADSSADRDLVSRSARTSIATSSTTGTNVQEAGVDEPDAVKTSGDLLVRLRGAELTTYDVGGERVEEVGSLDLGDFHDGEILLAGDTVVAVGNDGSRPPSSGAFRAFAYGAEQPVPQTRVLSVDVADPTTPTLERTVDYDAALVATRQHGDDVRVVLSKGLPDLDFDSDDAGTGNGTRAVSANRALVEDTTLDDWLPHVSVDGGEPTDLLSCDRVAVPRAELGLATMAVVGFGAGSPGETEAFGLAGEAAMTYESTDHLYLAASGGDLGGGFDDCFDCFRATSSSAAFSGTTHVYDFALDGTSATYVGAGEVEGSVRDRWAMDEVDGVLRLAVGPSSETADANSVVTLRAEGDELVEVGRLDGLGPNEDLKAVRWFDGLAVLVTFRRIDPLYAVDMADPADPTLLGELKIPGFSTYLHPLGPRRIVGVGSDGRSGAQAGLFDLTDVTDPQQLDVTSYGPGSYAKAGDDPRQFTWLPDRRVVLTVIARGRGGFVSRLQLGGGQMRNEMTQVEFGADVDAVRLVPLADGQVALVTGEDVEFFDVD